MIRFILAGVTVGAMSTIVIGVHYFLLAASWVALLSLAVVLVTTFLNLPLIGWPASGFLAVAAAYSLTLDLGIAPGGILGWSLAFIFFVAIKLIAIIAVYECFSLLGAREQAQNQQAVNPVGVGAT